MKMNKLGKMKGALVVAAQILTMTLLAACATVGNTVGTAVCTTVCTTTPLTACHATGDPANPYEEITITNDIFPVPANGCPTGPVSISEGKITICHATGSQTNPYNKITVSVNGLNGHGAHEGDVFSAADGSCPASSGVIGSGAISSTVCHATGDLANPYEEITVNSADLNAYCGQHPNDINPVPANSCPTSPVVISNGKITICHATSSQTNPYNEITVSVNGLNGHNKHGGDIIPVPAGGCPTSPKDDKPRNDKKP